MAIDNRQYEIYLGAFYATLCGVIAYKCEVDASVTAKCQFILLVVWIGFILGVSLMEAWVKFRAPLLEKFVAVDVGRYVFSALNIVECVFCVTLWVLGRSGTRQIPFVVASLMLALQVVVITPALDRRAKHLIVDTISTDAMLEKQPRLGAYRDELRGQLGGRTAPAAAWHFVYVAMEVGKAVLLGIVAWSAI
jgi:hypothetical protein